MLMPLTLHWSLPRPDTALAGVGSRPVENEGCHSSLASLQAPGPDSRLSGTPDSGLSGAPLKLVEGVAQGDSGTAESCFPAGRPGRGLLPSLTGWMEVADTFPTWGSLKGSLNCRWGVARSRAGKRDPPHGCVCSELFSTTESSLGDSGDKAHSTWGREEVTS